MKTILKNYIKFLFEDIDNTRIGRKDYVLGCLSLFGILVVVLLFGSFFKSFSIFLLIYILVCVFCFIGFISLSIKRLHDTNHSHWYMFFIIVPLLNFLLYCFLIFEKGVSKDNPHRIQKFTI